MSTRVTLCDTLAAYFKARPNTWIDGMELARVAGQYAWRSRVSNLRRPRRLGGLYEMAIENRQRRIHRQIVIDGKACAAGSYVVSEYRYVPVAQQQSEVA